MNELKTFIQQTQINVIGCYDTGAYISRKEIKGDYDKAFTNDIEEIENLYKGLGDKEGRAKGHKIKLYRFIPQDYDLLVFDLDRGHGDGLDGVSCFFDMIKYLSPPCPSWLYSLETIPFYVSTPRGGVHLYFRTDIKYKADNLGNGVEIKAGKTSITVVGSEKKEGLYKPVGDIHNIPLLPHSLTKILKTQNQEITNNTQNITNKKQKKKPKQYKNKPSFDLLMNWTIKEVGTTSRNILAFRFSLKAREYYTQDETRAYLYTCSEVAGIGNQEINTATESGFSDKYKRGRNI